MMKPVAIVVLLLACAGCGTVSRISGKEGLSPVYPATDLDANMMRMAATGEISVGFSEPVTALDYIILCPLTFVFDLVDMPISLVTDTLCLPYDLWTRTDDAGVGDGGGEQ